MYYGRLYGLLWEEMFEPPEGKNAVFSELKL